MSGEKRETASVELRLMVPRSWRDRLAELAAESAISISSLVRIYLRDALYGRKP